MNKSKIELLEKILNYIAEITHIYSKVDEIREKINRIILLKESINFSKFEQYELLFSPMVDKESYIDLLKKIAETALKFGFKNYPEDVDKCFYCNQTLKDENKSLLKSIHELVGNQANKEVQELNDEIKLFASRIDQVITKIISGSNYIEVGEIYSISAKQLLNIHDIQRNVLSKESLELLKSEVDVLNKNITSISEKWIEAESFFYTVKSEKDILINNVGILTEKLLSIEKTRADARTNLENLQDLEFCVNQKNVIRKTIDLLNLYSSYFISSNSFSGYKTKISKDKGRVEKKLIRANYLGIFDNYLDYFELAKRDKIIRPFSNPDSTSKIEAKIESNGASFEVSTILSEGEAKVFSLCDWLTELEFDESEILIFDDPITSLDQVNMAKF